MFPQARIWRPWFLHGRLGQVQRGNSLPSLATLCCPPIPLHASRQAAIGLLLHDCAPHKVPRPSCLQRSLKFPSPTSLPSSLRGMLWNLPQCTYCRCATATSSTKTKQAGAQVPCVQGQRWAHPHGASPTSLGPSPRLVLTQAHRPQVQLGSGIPSSPKADGTMYKHTW